jgi:predicted 3-demethylubiquinone-9 3-methyltransferase (glyoxalase superfamily)
MPRITLSPCLWFSDAAEEAATFYTGIFPDSRIVRVSRYGKEGYEIHGRPEGSVLTVDFVLDGYPFTALNGGPHFTFSEAVSFQVICRTQEEVDHYWARLGEGGDPRAQQCGWLKDRFGVSWQVIPGDALDMFASADRAAADRAMLALLGMKKLDLAALQRAFEGGSASA